MIITFRRTGGVLGLIVVAAVALAAAVVTVAVAATVLVAALTIAAIALVARSVLPRSRRRDAVPSASAWPHDTIDTTAVPPSRSTREIDPPGRSPSAR